MKKKALKIADCALLIAYLVFSVFLTVFHAVHFSAYYLFLSAASFIMPFLPNVAYRVFRLRPIHALTIISRFFIFLAFHIGMVCSGYTSIPFYDKAVHTFSGIFFAFLGVIAFYKLKHNHKAEKTDLKLCTAFSFSFSMTIAAVWEIYEYIIGFILKTDPQCVAATGVGDTMGDIIACLIGTILLCAIVIQNFKTDTPGLILSSIDAIYENENIV